MSVFDLTELQKAFIVSSLKAWSLGTCKDSSLALYPLLHISKMEGRCVVAKDNRSFSIGFCKNIQGKVTSGLIPNFVSLSSTELGP